MFVGQTRASILRNPSAPLVLVVIVAVLVRLYLALTVVDFEDDSYIRFYQAFLLSKRPFDISNHWVWPPIFQYLNLLILLAGGTVTDTRLLSAMFGTLSVAFAYFISLRLSGSEMVALLSAFFLAFNPLSLVYDSLAMSEPLYNLLFLASLALIIYGRYLWGSIPLALGVLTRYELWALLPFLLLVFIAWDSRHSSPYVRLRSDRAKLFVLPALAVALWLAANQIQFGNPLRFATGTQAFAVTEPDIVERTKLGWYLGFKLGLDPVLTVLAKFGVYSLIYPALYTTVLFPFAYIQIKRLRKAPAKTKLLTAVAVFYMAVLTLTLITGSNIGFARHAIAVITLVTILGSIRFARRFVVSRMERQTINRAGMLLLGVYLIGSLIALNVHVTLGTNYIAQFDETAGWFRENARGLHILCDYKPVAVRSGLPLKDVYMSWMDGGIYDQTSFRAFVTRNQISFACSAPVYIQYLAGYLIVFKSRSGNISVFDVQTRR